DGTNLELPLSGHNLGVDAGNLQSCLEAGVEVSFDDGASEDLVGADAAVVAALGGREAARGEAEWPGAVEERVLLLDAEVIVIALDLLSHCSAGGPGVGRVGGHVG